MKPPFFGLVAAASIAAASIATTASAQGSNREREGLVGRVSIVRAEYVHATRAGDGFKEDGQRRQLGNVTYDEAGNYAVREVIDDYGFPVGKETFAYTKGRLTSAQLVDLKGGVMERREYAYGSSSQYESVTITDLSGRAWQEHYTRGVGDRIEAIRYVSEMKDLGNTAFTYRGDAQKPDEIAFFIPGGRPATAPVGPCLGAHRVVYRYVEGRVSEREIYEDNGALKRKSSFKYDGRGNVAEETRTDGPTRSLFQYEYRYDDRGNWIRKVETIRYGIDRTSEPESPLVRVTTRTITYY
jgi:hypothetical protein